ncbi:hypothetical protein ABZ471_41870, partial [Streptomyces sp. NPDC005728]|uniref:hypothetical protein n=1 Tax=Streptomyces sp. NPDC005728 TaxID=3157054 RepID=UPI0033CDD5ED
PRRNASGGPHRITRCHAAVLDRLSPVFVVGLPGLFLQQYGTRRAMLGRLCGGSTRAAARAAEVSPVENSAEMRWS